MTDTTTPVTVQIYGRDSNRFFILGPIHADRLGVEAVPGKEYALRLKAGADGTAVVQFPNGIRLTAAHLTHLAHKSGNPTRGWEIDTYDGGGFPSE